MTVKTKRLLVSAVVAVVATALNYYFDLPSAPVDTPVTSDASSVSTTTSTSVVGKFLVERVVDGDTIVLDNGEKVRYIGVDTPESVDPRQEDECFGREATSFNASLVEGKRVTLEKDVSERDAFKRLLRYVYLEDGTFVNLKLVEEGYARAVTYPPDVTHSNDFVRAERVAREAKRGLWGNCE